MVSIQNAAVHYEDITSHMHKCTLYWAIYWRVTTQQTYGP